MAIHAYIGGPTFVGSAEEINRQCEEYEMACARAGEEPFSTWRRGDLIREANAAIQVSANEKQQLDDRFSQFKVRLNALKTRHIN